MAAGGALQFDGNDDVVSIPNTSGSLNFGTTFTVEAWVKPQSLAGGGSIDDPFKAIVSSGNSDVAPYAGSWVLFLDRLDYSSWGLSVCVPGCNAAQSASGSLQVGGWQHLAATYDGTNIKIYLNADLIATTPKTGDVTNAAFVHIGNWETAANSVIDEVRLWNVARTQADIRADMNRPLSPPVAGLVGYWRFDESSGQTVLDSTANGNHGRLGSSTDADAQDPVRVISEAPLFPPGLALTPIADKTVNAREELSFLVNATGADIESTLTFSLVGLPVEATLTES